MSYPGGGGYPSGSNHDLDFAAAGFLAGSAIGFGAGAGASHHHQQQQQPQHHGGYPGGGGGAPPQQQSRPYNPFMSSSNNNNNNYPGTSQQHHQQQNHQLHNPYHHSDRFESARPPPLPLQQQQQPPQHQHQHQQHRPTKSRLPPPQQHTQRPSAAPARAGGGGGAYPGTTAPAAGAGAAAHAAIAIGGGAGLSAASSSTAATIQYPGTNFSIINHEMPNIDKKHDHSHRGDFEVPREAKTDAMYYFTTGYLRSLGFEDVEIEVARNEWVDGEPPLCLTDEMMRDYAGVATFAFFRFLKFLCIITTVLFILALINYIMYANKEKPQFKDAPNRAGYSDFFISAYTESQLSAWLGTSIAGLVTIFLGLFFYRKVWIGDFVFVDKQMSLAELENTVQVQEDLIIRYTKEGQIDVSAHYRSRTELYGRRLISFLVFCGFVAAQVFSSVAITDKQEEQESNKTKGSIGQSFAIAFIAAGLNMLFTMISRQLTEFEKYEDLGHADRSLVVKLVCFKIANLMAVYGAKDYKNTQCVYDIIGEQFMTLIIVEIIFVTPAAIVTAWATTRYHRTIASLTGGILGDDKTKARFELPIEYLRVLYKFYLAAMAVVVFPLSALMSFFALVFEFWGARFRLIKLCGQPTRSEENHRNVVPFILLLILISVIATPFAGAAFVLSGQAVSDTNTTHLCNFPP